MKAIHTIKNNAYIHKAPGGKHAFFDYTDTAFAPREDAGLRTITTSAWSRRTGNRRGVSHLDPQTLTVYLGYGP